MKETKKEKIQGIIIAIMAIIIVVGGAFFASELKYCSVDSSSEVELSKIGMTEFTTLLNNEDASIIYIAREGCVYCQQQKPIVKQLSSEYDLIFHYLDTDDLTEDDMMSIFSLDNELFGEDGKNFGTPTTLVVKNGKIIDSLVGLTQKNDFEVFLQDNGFIK
ncbi:MAG: thioredoxin family protein [bacterium]|nr:thioredoxin family protein [bacterium]